MSLRSVGRPRVHKRGAIVRLVCSLISQGELVTDACKHVNVTRKTLHRWLEEDESYRHAFERARISQSHALAEEAIALADSSQGMSADGVAAMRLRVDTRKWLTSKIAPRIYGDPTRHVELTGKDGAPIQVEDVGQLRDSLTSRLAGIASRRKLLTATARVLEDEPTDVEPEPDVSAE